MAPIAGWYDDPRDPNGLRYWDGAAWTEHVRPKPQPAPPSTPVYPGAEQAQRQSWQYGQGPQTWQQTGWQQSSARPTTPDGAIITTWGKRLAAWLLDQIFVVLASLPLTGYFFYRSFQAVSDAMNDGSYDMFSPPGDLIRWEVTAVGIIGVFGLLYQAYFLRRNGATPGKRILDISVRSWDRPGQMAWATVGRRAGFVFVIAAAGLVPVLGFFATIVAVLDYLFPLWDKRRQALHDKVANTVVIEGRRAESA